ncbi:aldehyde dehydrogenase family protein [Arthrobacter sp. M4]|uniref:aldehyde dehydrogenase family protein n=1 Tax=Arthrobacter sp. M4 TaxID=218160 RepID=UPI001CDB8829|nr:aldehyde dehydrogenase family protein [Arthrobacter sp. M4]MCA4133797.1 aldehyde dehydrogenase family protein [Arthrobacter sp. M4]
MDAASTVSRARAVFAGGSGQPLSVRLKVLLNMRKMLTEHQDDFVRALQEDLGKPRGESLATEIGFTLSEIAHIERNLERWLRPRPVPVPRVLLPAKAWTELTPLGTVLVIGPWNYPVNLTLSPLAGALAAGNTAVLKPSELAPATSAILARLVREYLAPYAEVVEGAVPEATALLAERFDHVFFTGGHDAARAVMRAAAENLTPVTLELGGKCPAYVADSRNLAQTATRIAWARFMNAGQTCVAPDYVMAEPALLDSLERELKLAITRLFGSDPASSASYGRIVDARHFDRLSSLVDRTTVVHGGQREAATRYFAPTLVRPDAEDAVMKEEIFGPILPLVAVNGQDEAIRHINTGPKPLALYLFGAASETRRAFAERTSSGALNYDVPAAHLSVPGLPFGGVGGSGMGAYHGEHSVRTFSHERSTLNKPLRPDTLRFAYPPYNAVKESVLKMLTRRR